MSNLCDKIIGSIVAKDKEMENIEKEAQYKCDELSRQIETIKEEARKKIFDVKASKSSDYLLLHEAFSASIPEWADFLIPILNQNTDSNWELDARWFGNTIEPGIIEKYLLHRERYFHVDGYVVQLISDNKKYEPIVFLSRTYDSYSSKVYEGEDLKESIYLDNGKIDLDKLGNFCFLNKNETLKLNTKESELSIEYDESYPFLREPIINRAENYLENVVDCEVIDSLDDIPESVK